jgi:hypothetical protein
MKDLTGKEYFFVRDVFQDIYMGKRCHHFKTLKYWNTDCIKPLGSIPEEEYICAEIIHALTFSMGNVKSAFTVIKSYFKMTMRLARFYVKIIHKIRKVANGA